MSVHKPHATPLRDEIARSQTAHIRRTVDVKRCATCGRKADSILRAKNHLFAGSLCLGCLADQRALGRLTEVLA